MKLSKKGVVVILGLGLLAGCASSGNEALRHESSQTIANKIIEGKTTSSEVQSMFGAPTSTSFTGNGLEIWQYDFEKVSADAISYIPIVSSFGGTASGTKKELTILFDDHSVVKKVRMTEAAIKHKTGLFNQ
jgi:outer membrane protein assembly factor BamE (lipoprotein component of BamABCDE complex)